MYTKDVLCTMDEVTLLLLFLNLLIWATLGLAGQRTLDGEQVLDQWEKQLSKWKPQEDPRDSKNWGN